MNRQRKVEHFDEVLETAPFAIYEIDYKTPHFKRVNQAMCILSGYSEEELLSMNPADLLDAESAQRFKDRIRQGLAGQKIDESVEFRLKAKDGHDIWAILHVKPTYKNGKLDSAIVVGYDITDHKKAEDALKQSEKKFSTLVEHQDNIVMIVDKKLRITFMNKFGQNFFGYTAEEIIGKSVIGTTIPPLDSEGNNLIAMAKDIIKNPEKYKTNVHKNRLRNGRLVWISWVNSPIYDQNGNLSQILAVGNDVSKLKEAEDALKESEQVYKTIFDNRDDGFVLVEPIYDENKHAIDIRFLQINFAYEQQTGTKAAKVEGKRAKEVAPNLEEEWISLCGEVAKTRRTRRIESFNKRTNKWYDANYIPFNRGRVGILFRDVTERKNLEKRLQDKERLATIGATAGMVGHDIRNPLQAIVSDVYLLKGYLASMPEMPMKADVAESLDEIEKNIGYINKIVADLQDYARQLKPEYSDYNLYELAVDVLRSITIPEGISTLIEIEKSLRFETDSTLFQRILTNLAINAVQAMPTGGLMRIGASANSGQIVVTVEDTGVGIPEHVKPKLFTPMMTTKAKGQGFGLAVVKKSVEALGGSITFESQEGRGTKFVVQVPQHKR